MDPRQQSLKYMKLLVTVKSILNGSLYSLINLYYYVRIILFANFIPYQSSKLLNLSIYHRIFKYDSYLPHLRVFLNNSNTSLIFSFKFKISSLCLLISVRNSVFYFSISPLTTLFFIPASYKISCLIFRRSFLIVCVIPSHSEPSLTFLAV